MNPPDHPRLPLLAESYRRLTGRLLVPSGADLPRALWEAPRVIVAHGSEPDPVFFYGNRLALVNRLDPTLHLCRRTTSNRSCLTTRRPSGTTKEPSGEPG